MVFLSLALLARNRGPDEFWRKRKVFKLAAHFKGRRRNCYSIAIRNVHRALVYSTVGRRLKKEDMKNLWVERLNAACEQHNFTFPLMQESLVRSNVLLNKKTLANLSIWEPRSFKALTKLSWSKASQEGLAGVSELGDVPEGVITRGMLK